MRNRNKSASSFYRCFYTYIQKCPFVIVTVWDLGQRKSPCLFASLMDLVIKIGILLSKSKK